MKSLTHYVTRGLLLASGLIAVGIAMAIIVSPDAFYAAYGIEVGADASLLNELKAPSVLLLVAGIVMLFGVRRAEFATTSLATAAVVYLSFGLSRLLSTAMHGIPEAGLVNAAILELAIGGICLIDLLRLRARRLTSRPGGWNTAEEGAA